MAEPKIIDNPELGLTVSAVPDGTVFDVRTPEMGYPYLSPEHNRPIDDAHRINHAMSMMDHDMRAIRLSSLLDLPTYLFLHRRP